MNAFKTIGRKGQPFSSDAVTEERYNFKESSIYKYTYSVGKKYGSVIF